MNINTIAALYRQMEWADAAVWKAVLASEGAQTDEKLRDYLLHMHAVQRVFLLVWRGEPLGTTYPKFDDLKSLMAWGRGYYGEVFAYLDTVGDEKLSEPMAMPWASMVEQQIGRPPDVTTVGDTALQVPLHTMYHRGQVNARLKVIGGEPPLVDYIAWVWLGRPEPEWPPV